MTCEAFEALLDKLLDGEATQADTQAMNDHAAQCPLCAARLETARCLTDDLSSSAQPAIDEEAYAAFQKGWRTNVAHAAKARKPRRMNNAARTALSMAAALVFLAGGTLLTRGRWTNVLTAPEAAEQGIMLASMDSGETESAADTASAADLPMAARFARSIDAPQADDTANADAANADAANADAANADAASAKEETSMDKAPAAGSSAPVASFWADMAAFLIHALPWLAGVGGAALLVLIGTRLYILKEKRREKQ